MTKTLMLQACPSYLVVLMDRHSRNKLLHRYHCQMSMLRIHSPVLTTTHRATFQVVYNSKTPVFHDEIKIKLPTKLTKKMHLLFTFYNVSVQKPKKGEDELESPIGYAVLPLYENGMHIQVGDVKILVHLSNHFILDLPAGRSHCSPHRDQQETRQLHVRRSLVQGHLP